MACELFKSDDWKKEKHVPAIECPDTVAAGEFFEIRVSLGKEIAHPNETKHHICWIRVYFMAEGAKFPYEIGSFEFSAHGASVDGPDTSGVYTNHMVVCAMKTGAPGTITATSYCNIHGLWESSKAIALR